MNQIIYDKKTKAVFKASKINDHINLIGVNVKGSFKVSIKAYEHPESGLIVIEDQKKISKLIYKGGWPKRLVEILMLKVKTTSVTLNFDPPKKKAKSVKLNFDEPVKKPTKVKKETKKTTKKSNSDEFISLAVICDELGISPGAARGRLRGRIDKPAQGWKWSTDVEVARVKELLK